MNAMTPSNWKSSTLGECCEIVSGGTPKRAVAEYWGGEIPWVTPKDISDLACPEFSNPPENISSLGLKKSSAALLPAGAILMSSRAPIGLLAIAAKPMATNQGFKSFVPGPELDSRFLYYALRRLVPLIQDRGTGATFKEVSKTVVSEIPISFPVDIREQRRIAAILDKSEGIRRKHQDVLKMADTFLSAVFKEMFGDPTRNRCGFPIGTIRDLVEDVRYGTSKKATVDGGAYPVLRMGNITYSGSLDVGDLKFVDLDEGERRKYILRQGDILFNRTNSPDLVGKTAVFDLEDEYSFAGYLVRARAIAEVADPYYISGYLNSKHGKATLRGMCKSIIGMANINAQEMQNIEICIPPISLQRKYRGLCRRIDKVKKVAIEGDRNGADVFSALSQKAFRGEL